MSEREAVVQDSSSPIPAFDDAVLSARSVSHSFSSDVSDTTVLSDVSLSVASGDFMSLVGPSGCGKSTLLRGMSGLIKLDSGQVTFRGEVLRGPKPEHIGLIFQDARLFPWKTVLENVMFPTVLQGRDRHESRTTARELISLVGLDGFERSYPHQLSGGMKQRVAIARGLIQRPEVLLMDEPFGALDEFTREAMGLELLRVWEQTGVTIVFVTHSIDEAILLSDYIAVMTARPGRINEVLEVDLTRPRDTRVAVSPEFVELRRHIRDHLFDGRQGDSP